MVYNNCLLLTLKLAHLNREARTSLDLHIDIEKHIFKSKLLNHFDLRYLGHLQFMTNS